MQKQYYVYILASKKDAVLYIGVTSDLLGRTWQHKHSVTGGFSSKYNVKMLVYYEVAGTAESAIHREKRLKKYRRAEKISLIEKGNPEWKDLWYEIIL